MKRHKYFILGIFILTAAFILIRIKPLYFQTVGYTYDQGRDFLKAAEIVQQKQITFLGPTTGITGLYHGAWWYYILTIPFLIFRGNPIGFYYFNLLIQLAAFLGLFFFSRKFFGQISAYIFSILIIFSPYFTFTSLFVGNNIMVLPVILCFLIVNFIIFEDYKVEKSFVLSFFNGLLLGLIAEFELSFGIFLIPVYFFALIIFPRLRRFLLNFKRSLLFTFGLMIAFAPRALFELKHQFQQTKILLSFIFHPKMQASEQYINIFQERFKLFKYYYESIFPNHNFVLLFNVLIIIFLFAYIWQKRKKFTASLLFYSYLIFMLFLLTTFYEGFFWANYYEGIQYLFIFTLLILLSAPFRFHKMNFNRYLKIGLLIVLGLFMVVDISLNIKKVPKKEGLAVTSEVVSYINSHEKNLNDYCVRIYTPPVIPHTYNYIFLSNRYRNGIHIPQTEWVKGSCWFIMETDPFKFRLVEWLKTNRPQKETFVDKKQISDVSVYHYVIK